MRMPFYGQELYHRARVWVYSNKPGPMEIYGFSTEAEAVHFSFAFINYIQDSLEKGFVEIEVQTRDNGCVAKFHKRGLLQ
jgi:hypothetical protein